MPRRRQATRHGWVIIDKPAGWTSHDVVAKVRGIVDERRVGHAGTLDPAATGVLPIAVGLATRTVEYLANADKAYRAWIRFGIVTDSADGDGTVIAQADASKLTLTAIEPVLEAFRGEVQQVPPMHSALKIGGRRLYELARKGEEVDVAPRPVTIHELQVVEWDPPVLCVDVTCSKGTYIRSLARDIGDRVGTGAYLERLVRTRSGPFTLDDALTLDELAERGWDRAALPPDAALGDVPAITLTDDEAMAWSQGRVVPLHEAIPGSTTVRAYNADGTWLGVGETAEAGQNVRPVKVIAAR